MGAQASSRLSLSAAEAKEHQRSPRHVKNHGGDFVFK